MKKLGKYSFGVGDRFAHQAAAQLSAFQKAKEQDLLITPVWNKSFREHQIIHSDPAETRREADRAVKENNWKDSYFVDADHVSLKSVDFFTSSCDFFTIDVADFIGQSPSEQDIHNFVKYHQNYCGSLDLQVIDETIAVNEQTLEKIANNYLKAIQEAGRIYQKILNSKDEGSFIVEVSMDETDQPQSPVEILFIELFNRVISDLIVVLNLVLRVDKDLWN